MDNDRFARTIKNARLKKGYTQSQLADLLNVSNKTISKWETGVSQTKGYWEITCVYLLAKILMYKRTTLETECLFLCSVTAYYFIFAWLPQYLLVYSLSRACCVSNALAPFTNHRQISSFSKAEKNSNLKILNYCCKH